LDQQQPLTNHKEYMYTTIKNKIIEVWEVCWTWCCAQWSKIMAKASLTETKQNKNKRIIKTLQSHKTKIKLRAPRVKRKTK
jgi:hypothetical protein